MGDPKEQGGQGAQNGDSVSQPGGTDNSRDQDPACDLIEKRPQKPPRRPGDRTFSNPSDEDFGHHKAPQGRRDPPFDNGEEPPYDFGQEAPDGYGHKPPYQGGQNPAYDYGQNPPYDYAPKAPLEYEQNPPYRYGHMPHGDPGKARMVIELEIFNLFEGQASIEHSSSTRSQGLEWWWISER